jgi:hypothetical protein
MDNYNQITDVPGGQFLIMASSTYTSCAIHKQKEGVICWGHNSSNLITNAPVGGFYKYVSMGSGSNTACAVLEVT